MKLSITTLCFVGAAALAALTGPASAALVPSGGGDFDVVPLYPALAFGTVNFGGNGGAINDIDYASNVAPLPLATEQRHHHNPSSITLELRRQLV